MISNVQSHMVQSIITDLPVISMVYNRTSQKGWMYGKVILCGIVI